MDGRLGHEERPRDLLGGQAAEQAQRQRGARLGRKDRVAGDEHEAEQIVAELIVQCRVEIRLRRLLLDFELVAELLMLAFAQAVAAEDVDRPMLGGGHEPRAGIVRNAGPRPLLERRDEGVLGQFLGEADIAHHPRQSGDELRLLDPEDCLDGAVGVGRRHGDRLSATSIDGRKPPHSAAARVSAGLPQTSWPGSGIWRTSHSPSQPGMCVLCSSMKRSVHFRICAFEAHSKMA